MATVSCALVANGYTDETRIGIDRAETISLYISMELARLSRVYSHTHLSAAKKYKGHNYVYERAMV